MFVISSGFCVFTYVAVWELWSVGRMSPYEWSCTKPFGEVGHGAKKQLLTSQEDVAII